jgi:hypothetical protein
MNKKIAIFLLILLANVWIWRILGSLPLLGLGLMVLSFLLTFNYKIPSLILLAILGTFLLRNAFDSNFLQILPAEKVRVDQRHEFYSQGLGKIYKNRIGVYLNYTVAPRVSEFLNNLGYSLDPNVYFFAGHPRESGEAVEFEKFSYFLFPLFIFGIVSLLSGAFEFTVLYLVLSLAITVFVSPGYGLGPVLSFPFIVAVIYTGVLKIVKKWL